MLQQNDIEVALSFPKMDAESKKTKWNELTEIIKEKSYDFGVIASFGHMIPNQVIDAFPAKAVSGSDDTASSLMVMHPSLLPKFRGACPI